MTLKFNKVKINDQDDPITLSQIRALDDCYRAVLYRARSVIWAHSWGDNPAISLDEEYKTPYCWINPGVDQVAVVLIVDKTTAGNGTIEPDIIIGNNTYNPVFSVVTGMNYLTEIIELKNVSPGEWVQITWSSGVGAAYDGYFIGFYGHASIETRISVGFNELAAQVHLKTIATKINKINELPLFVAGNWEPQQITSDALSANKWSNYHAIDAADGDLREESDYMIGVVLDGSGTDGYHGQIKTEHEDSTNTVTTEINVSTAEQTMQLEGISGSSYARTPGTTSTININAAYTNTGGGTSYPQINTLGIWCKSQLPVSTDRMQDYYRTAVDTSHFNIARGEYIDKNTINSVGLALFNNYHRKGYQPVSYMPHNALKLRLNKSVMQPVCYLGHWIPDNQDYGILDGNQSYVVTIILESDANEAVEINFEEQNSSVYFGWKEGLSVGYNYIYKELSIPFGSGSLDNHSWLMTIKERNGSLTVYIWGVTIQKMYNDTY